MSIIHPRYNGHSNTTGRNPGRDKDAAIMLRPFDGLDGVDATPEELRIYRAGELVETISGPLIEQRAGVLDPHAGAPGFTWAAEVARHFPEDVFCFGQPVSFDLSVRLGTQALDKDLAQADTSVRAFYDPTLFESFDGELMVERVSRGRENFPDATTPTSSELPAGYANDFAGGCSQRVLAGGFQDWRKDVAELDGYPAYKRRLVDVMLPETLADHGEDLVLLHRVGEEVCEFIRRYVETGGQEIVHRAAEVDNLFAGGEIGPLPRCAAPVLYGRCVEDVYRSSRVSGRLARR